MSLTEADFNKMHGIDVEPVNPRARLGGNNPPDAIERSKDALAELSEFIKSEPVITDEDTARKAKLMIDRGRASVDEMESERVKKVKPLNDEVKRINDEYRGPKDILSAAVGTVVGRVNAFMDDMRLRREEEARKAAEEAERKIQEANAAIEAKAEANDNAAQGEVGIDTIAAEQEARAKIEEANKAIRVARRAEKATNIRVGGGWGRVLTQRTKETLIVTDWQKAITVLGLTDGIRDAVLTASRAHRKLHGELPDGVVSEKEKSL